MSESNFTVPIADLERGPKEVTWTLSTAWLTKALEGTPATPTGTEGHVTLELMKNGRDVIIQGSASVEVSLPCARTLDPAIYQLEPEIFLMLAPAGSEPGARRPRKRPEAARPPVADKKRSKKEPEDQALSEEEAAQDTYSGDKIALDVFIREFIVLDLPMFPLRSDLRSGQLPARGSPPPEPEKGPDPRLAPLAALLERARGTKTKGHGPNGNGEPNGNNG